LCYITLKSIEVLQSNTTLEYLSSSATCFGATNRHLALAYKIQKHKNTCNMHYWLRSIMPTAWGMRLIMHMACLLVFLSVCKVMPDVGSLKRNM